MAKNTVQIQETSTFLFSNVIYINDTYNLHSVSAMWLFITFFFSLHEELNISEHNYIDIMRKLSYHNQGHKNYLHNKQKKNFSFTFFFYFFLFNFFSLQKIHKCKKKSHYTRERNSNVKLLNNNI